MILIRKGAEPPALITHRCSRHADYANFSAKDELRKYLVREQGGICCYCMQRIEPDANKMKIEHWHCRDHFVPEELSYSNLLAACRGNEGQPRSRQHCDTRKGNQLLSRNPADPSHRIEDLIRYDARGRIRSDDSILDKELDEVLNLNYSQLVANRKAVLDGFLQGLEKRSPSPRSLQRQLSEWSDNGSQLKEYCGVVIYWLRKKTRTPT